MFATPEYKYGVPGSAGNAIDWASRPVGDSAWKNKPVAVMSAATGICGGLRSQYRLRQSFVFLNMHDVNQPEIMIANGASKFDANRNLTDETARKLVQQLAAKSGGTNESLVEASKQLSPSPGRYADKCFPPAMKPASSHYPRAKAREASADT